MKEGREKFLTDGYLLVENVLSVDDIDVLQSKIQALPEGLFKIKAGTRNLLSTQWCKILADKVKNHPTIQSLLPSDSRAVQCTYFCKTENANWLVAPHRDKAIPVSQRISSPHWTAWSVKEGVRYAQPPREVLEQLLAVRLHLDANTVHNSPLRIVPGSHTSAGSVRPEVACIIGAGGAVVMRPLALHASSKLLQGNRRVLHFLFGPRQLPDGAVWATIT